MLVWLENAFSRPFLRFFGGTFPPNDVTRPNIQRDHPWAEPRHLIAMIGLSCTVPRYKRAIMSKIAKIFPPLALTTASISVTI